MDLNMARIKINQLDKEIVQLLEKRLDVVAEIGKYKKENNIPIYDSERERLVLNNCVSFLQNKEYAKSIEEIYQQIMDSSKLLEAEDEKKKNIVIIGMPGSGKTTIGALVAKSLNMKFIDMDTFIEKEENMSISEMFQMSENYFRNAETNCAKKLSEENSLVVSTGGGIVKRKENLEYFKHNSIVVFLNRSLENIVSDIDIKTRPLLKENIDNVYKLYNERIQLYKESCDFEISNDSSIQEAVDKILKVAKTQK